MAIRLIERTELPREGLVAQGHRKNPLRAQMELMLVGQILHVPRADYRVKRRTPRFLANVLKKQKGLEFTVLKDLKTKDWYVERVG